jgi:8-amino-7-oxononanoate synthase
VKSCSKIKLTFYVREAQHKRESIRSVLQSVKKKPDPMELESAISNTILLDGKTFSYFGGNNYLALANHPALIEAAIAAIRQYGINFSASRQTTGTSRLHLELESSLSRFFQREDAVVFASGYLSNRIILQALRKRYTTIFYDELSHPSILDGFPGDVPSLNKYRHSDMQHLEQLLREKRDRQTLIITDGVFPLTGEIAPLDQIVQLADKYGSLVVVDDAHSAGVLGVNGRGTAEFFELEGHPTLYQTGTMSKAFGSYGGFISADRELIDQLRQSSSCYLASTALPPAMVAASIASLQIIREQPEMRENLADKSVRLKQTLHQLGYSTLLDPTPIVPLFSDSEEEAQQLSRFLKKNNIIAPHVKYPVKINKFIVRITLSAAHTIEQEAHLLETLNSWRKTHGIDPY